MISYAAHLPSPNHRFSLPAITQNSNPTHVENPAVRRKSVIQLVATGASAKELESNAKGALNRGFGDIAKAFNDAGKAADKAFNDADKAFKDAALAAREELNGAASKVRHLAVDDSEDSWGGTSDDEVWDEEELTRANKTMLNKIKLEQKKQDAIIEKMIEKLHMVDAHSKQIGEQLTVEQSALEKIKAENVVNTAELKLTIEHVNTSMGMGKGSGDGDDSDGGGGNGGGGGGGGGDDLIPKPTLAQKAKVGLALAKGVSTVSGLLG